MSFNSNPQPLQRPDQSCFASAIPNPPLRCCDSAQDLFIVSVWSGDGCRWNTIVLETESKKGVAVDSPFSSLRRPVLSAARQPPLNSLLQYCHSRLRRIIVDSSFLWVLTPNNHPLSTFRLQLAQPLRRVSTFLSSSTFSHPTLTQHG